MKRYETYKNSGVEWIGEIPEGWEVSRIKYNFSFGRGLSITKSDLVEKGERVISYGQIHSKLNTGTSINEALVRYVPQSLTEGHDDCKVNVGDFIFADTSEDKEGCGNCVYVDRDGVYAGYHSLVLKGNGENNKYFAYLFKSEDWRTQVRSKTYGVKVFSITQTIMSDCTIILPPLSEQQQISSYLDYKVGQIDSSLAKIVEQIEDLKFYRQSVISEAVTKGLNPNAKMKDSGVEWIGEIPEGWECVPMKRLASIQTGTTPSTSVYEYWSNPTFDWFTPGDFSEDKFILNNSKRKISLYAKEKNACRIFPGGTVYLVGIGATLGKIGYSEIEASANQQINAIIFNSNCFSKFGAYYLQAIRDYICSRANSSTLPILNQTETGELPFLLPSLSEQQQIASYLDSKTSKIDSSIEALELQKSQLEDYKRSVISEAVTGKVDLRGWKTNKC